MHEVFHKLFLLMVVFPLFLKGCAGSATHKVQTANTAYDSELTCADLRKEIIESQAIIDAVNKDKEDISGADVVDGLLYFPFNLIAKSENYNKALEAADKRIATCRILLKEKGCENEFYEYPKKQIEPVITPSVVTNHHEENNLEKKQNLSNEELSNEVKKLRNQLAKFEDVETKNEIAKYGNFIAYDDGTILDTERNLMWWQNCIEVSDFDNAQYKSKTFRGGGYSDWRVPSIGELKTIYVDSSNSKYKTIGLITLTTPYLLSKDFENAPDSAGKIQYLDFNSGRVRSYLYYANSFSPGIVALLPVRYAYETKTFEGKINSSEKTIPKKVQLNSGPQLYIDFEPAINFVVVDKSDPAFTVFTGIPKNTDDKTIDEIRTKISSLEKSEIITWEEFTASVYRYAQSTIIRNDYDNPKIINGLVCLVGKQPGPWGLCWNGGIAFTRMDYQYIKNRYESFKANPNSYKPKRDSRGDPVNPGGFMAYFGCPY